MMGDFSKRATLSSKPEVSVIVPVYNTGAFLDDCMESLISQTLKKIEIIIVDDGSSDLATIEKCDEWSARDDRVVVVHQKNGGLSDARNKGACLASADYVGFVDSDDIVHCRMFEILLEDAKAAGAEMACCDVIDLYESAGGDFPDLDESCVPVALTAEEAIKGMVQSKLPRIWIPTHLYAKSIFEKGFEFPVGRTYEDAFSIVDTFDNVSRVTANPAKLYGYFHHEGTITTSGYSARTHDIVDAWDHCYEVACQKYPHLLEDMEFRRFWARAIVLDRMVLVKSMRNAPQERALVGYLRKYFRQVKNHECMTRSRKIMSFLLCANLPMYRLAVRTIAKRHSK